MNGYVSHRTPKTSEQFFALPIGGEISWSETVLESGRKHRRPILPDMLAFQVEDDTILTAHDATGQRWKLAAQRSIGLVRVKAWW